MGVLLGELVLLAILGVVYRWFHVYDWGQPFTKLLCYGALFGLVVLTATAAPLPIGRWSARVEVAVLATALVVVLGQRTSDYARHLVKRARVDIGSTTQQAATVFFREHENPYGSELVDVRPEIAGRFPGFHYGPVMFAGYALSAFWPALGLKVTSALCLLGTVLALSMALWRGAGGAGLDRSAAVLFFSVAALLPERLWHELFRQGAIDILPVFLLALSVLGVQRARWFSSGVLLGLSLAAKFSPALFLLIVLLRRRTPRALLVGVLVGALPLLAFFLWDPGVAWDGIVLALFAVPSDSTSLYSITPPSIHFVLPLALLVAAGVTLCRNLDRPLQLEAMLRSFVLLLIFAELCYKEMHANHLIWSIPFVAFLLATRRRSFASAVAGALSLRNSDRFRREADEAA